jgi:hypothetical protein
MTEKRTHDAHKNQSGVCTVNYNSNNFFLVVHNTSKAKEMIFSLYNKHFKSGFWIIRPLF